MNMAKKGIYKLNLVLQHFQAKPWAINDFFCAKDVGFAVPGMSSSTELENETWPFHPTPPFFIFSVYHTDAHWFQSLKQVG